MADTSDLDQRLPIIRVRDVIIAVLQAAFSEPDLVGRQENPPFLFVREDPKRSKLSITSGEGRLWGNETDGRRMHISVTRGEYSPGEMFMTPNMQSMSFGGERVLSDLGSCAIFISCEAGNETRSETLASICYKLLKLFREEICVAYDIHSYKLRGVSPATQQQGVAGSPWVTTVTLQVTLQEIDRSSLISNVLHKIRVDRVLEDLTKSTVAQLSDADA